MPQPLPSAVVKLIISQANPQSLIKSSGGSTDEIRTQQGTNFHLECSELSVLIESTLSLAREYCALGQPG